MEMPVSSTDLQPRLFRAPGRVNLIGEHTDYNHGFVLPIAINFSTWVSLTPLAQRKLKIFSENFGEAVEFNLDDTSPTRRGHWSDYVIGVAVTLERSGHRLRGARLSLRGEVPIGSGLSSSASVEVATAFALAANADLEIDRSELAQLCRQAENEYVGARVGIMDQFVSLYGRARKALLLDCRSLEYRLLPISDNTCLVVCNTMVKHELAGGAYNERRAQCEAGVAFLAQKLPNVTALRDVTIDQLNRYSSDLPEGVFRRCRHVVTENARVVDAANSLSRGDSIHLGKLMLESHRSLRDDFEVSCRELDLMVGLAREIEGVYGARLTGGGFGGCTVNLVSREQVDEFKARVGSGYERETKVKPEIYVLEAANGAEELAVKG
jgi:galactokinase